MNNVPPLGDPGALTSAIQTKTNLELDVHGPGGIGGLLYRDGNPYMAESAIMNA